jgi:hypothetical protein
MAEGCTFVASPFKASHCKLCFQAKVDHKIPVLKAVTVTPTKSETPSPVTTSSPTPAPTTSTPPVKTYKYQTNPQPVKVEEKVVEQKPVKTYKYQTNPQPVVVHHEKPKPSFSISETVEVEENGVVTTEPVKKSFKPVGGIKMQGFDPNMLVKAAAERRAKKNLDSGELEETQGAAEEVKEETAWEPVPSSESANYRRGPGADILGGGLAAVLQKRKDKEAAHAALSNPNSIASEDVIEEVVSEPVSIPNNNNSNQENDVAPTTETTPITSTPTEETKQDDDDQDWS